MSRVNVCVLVSVFAVMTYPVVFGQSDSSGSKDYPGTTRMPGYYISDYSESQFDSYSFKVTEGGKEKEQSVEGHLYNFRYDLKENATSASALQILRNYQNAARAAGGQVLREAGTGNERETTIRFSKGGSEVWMAIRALSTSDYLYFLTIIERQAMQQDVAVDANALSRGLDEAGRVAVYGIYFDTGKAELKPESNPALIEIAKLLNQNPSMKLYVVGHTDMVADLATNMKLSQARAQAVVNALVTQHGIAGARLTPFGAGPYAPVASNKTEEGRAKNRRVELVEIATK